MLVYWSVINPYYNKMVVRRPTYKQLNNDAKRVPPPTNALFVSAKILLEFTYPPLPSRTLWMVVFVEGWGCSGAGCWRPSLHHPPQVKQLPPPWRLPPKTRSQLPRIFLGERPAGHWGTFLAADWTWYNNLLKWVRPYKLNWLVVSTQLKNYIVKLGIFPK